MTTLRAVDADGHVEEAHVNWSARIAEPYRKIAPEPRPATDSHWRLVMEGKPWPIPSGPGVGIGGPYSRPHPRREGMKDPDARLIDMDNEVSIWPCFSAAELPDRFPLLNPGFAAAVARARNDWLAEYCAASRSRLEGVAVLPQQDIAGSVDELKRWVSELGFVGVSPFPNLRGRHLAIRTAFSSTKRPSV